MDEVLEPTVEEENSEAEMVERKTPEVPEARKNLVTKLCQNVAADKSHWKDAFSRMKDDQDFAIGRQWSDNEQDDRYVANITLRHVQQRVAALYAKNPKVVATVKQKLMTSVWDGTMTSVMGAVQNMGMAAQNPMMAGSPEMAKSMAILQEAQAVSEQRDQMEQFAKTLELLYAYNVDEQAHPFKSMMKMIVRRGVTTGVGYVKIGYQRIMEPRPDLEAQIADATQQLATAERLSAEAADQNDIKEDTDPELERLRLVLQDLEATPGIVVREGLVFDYPDATCVIPDRNCRQLREFLGCDYVTQEYVLSPERVQEIYGLDVRSDFRQYNLGKDGRYEAVTEDDFSENEDDKSGSCCVVWEIYSRTDGLVYVVCDGYPDFLREPAQPAIWTERFWPWYPLVLNETDHTEEIYPPSDVRLLMPQQMEYNRLREGLREHRKQNRPLTISASGVLSDEDREVLKTRPGASLVELDGLQPQQNIRDVLQPMQFSGVDPNLYEVNGVFEDVLRTVGVQEANLGGTTGNTATESSIAESSRMSSLQSNIDEIDDMLSRLARAAGQILLAETNEETVKEIVGPAAVWPTLSREQLAKEVFLDVEAGSTGRPNQAQEIQNFERMAPLLMQIPGVVPEKMAKEALRRLDDKLVLEDFYDENLPSMSAMNTMLGQAPGGVQQNAGADAPAAQGAAGASNAQTPDRVAGAPGGPEMPLQGPPTQ